MNLTLVVGDGSDDGHGRTRIFNVELNVEPGLKLMKGSETCPGLEDYFRIAVEKGGIPDFRDYFEDYQACTIGGEVYQEICRILEIKCNETKDVRIGADVYAFLWVSTVNLGIRLNGEIAHLQILANEKVPRYDIGGYGLFD